MIEYGIIRHGFKPEVGKERKSLEESGLSKEQQKKWQEALDFLELQDPGITYESLSIIENMAEDLYNEIPDKSTVVFFSTNYPRTKMTAELISSELIRILQEKKDKDIGVSFLWDPKDEDSTKDILNFDQEAQRVHELMEDLSKNEESSDQEFEEYLKDHQAGKTFQEEDKKLRQVVNTDLASKNSVYRKRAKLLKKQLKKLVGHLEQDDRPVYFFGIGHHPNLITLDVAFNKRSHYSDSDKVPKPLTLWKIESDKVKDFIKD